MLGHLLSLWVVRRRHDAWFADRADDVEQEFFAGLAGDDHVTGSDKIAGFGSLTGEFSPQ